MTFEAITNRNEFFSNHYLDAVIDGDLNGIRGRWQELEDRGEATARSRLRGLPSSFFTARAAVTESGPSQRPAALAHLNDLVLDALGFTPARTTWELKRNTDSLVSVPVATAVETSGGLLLLAVEAGMVDSVDDFGDFDPARVDDADPQPSRLLKPLLREADNTAVWSAFDAVGELFATDEPPRYVLVLGGRVVVLAERAKWADGRYLAVDLDAALERNDVRKAGELETIASLFSNDAVNPEATSEGEGGGQSILDELVDSSHKHAVGVSKDLRHGIRDSIELLANEVIELLDAQARARNQKLFTRSDVDARRLSSECLRYLYRLLVLLYAESRPELGILPVDDEAYLAGYSVDRLRELCLVELTTDEARDGSHLHESLTLLFELVNDGYHATSAEQQLLFDAGTEDGPDARSVEEYLQFPGLDAQLFDPAATELINRVTLRNETLQRVLRNLMLSTGKSRRDSAGFISYAQLGINQLGAVYEGLMAYTGFFASTDLYEVAKGGDPEDGTWMLPVDRADDFDDDVFVTRVDEVTGRPERVLHPANSFVFRLSGRDRQRSASYYTPEVLTRCVVRHALAELLGLDDYAEPNGSSGITSAAELLELTICEPALGSGAFANEAINQLAAEYLRRRQAELDETLDPDRYARELQKVKAHFALHQTYGVDLNATAVELAEVSLWLNAMYPGLKAPWFGLQLRNGNSLIGCRHATWRADQLGDRPWAQTKKSSLQPPVDRPLSAPGGVGSVPLADDEIHHFLLPGHGWAAVADRKEAKELRPDEVDALKKWRKGVLAAPGKAHAKRLAALAAGVEALWQAAAERIRLTQRGLRRDIDVYGADPSTGADGVGAGEDGGGSAPAPVSRRQAREVLADPNSPLGRLRMVMDAWVGLWFWPLDSGQRPPSWDEWLAVVEELVRPDERHGLTGQLDLFDDLAGLLEAERDRQRGTVTVEQIAAAHPWLTVAVDAARAEGAWHWQLEFAPVFQQGGFDLQVGNPPWVRPRWLEDLVLAEHDPWWGVVDKPGAKAIKDRRAVNLSEPGPQADYLAELASAEGTVEVLGSAILRPMLAGIQTNLYMVFMDTVWRHLGDRGTAGLLHPESHFTDPKAGDLRRATYGHLRRHWHFLNEMQLFEEIGHTRNYGINVYSSQIAPRFAQATTLFHPSTVDGSLDHSGIGPEPGVQLQTGGWDLRPHRARMVTITEEVLADWARLFDEPGTPAAEARLLRPVTTADLEALSVLADQPVRLADHDYHWTAGWHEKGAKTDGTIRWETAVPDSWDDVILQGPHFSVATPFAKQPNENCKSKNDYSDWDLESLPERVIPRTNYQPACDPATYTTRLDHWNGRPYSASWRMIWRRMTQPGLERSMQPALLAPGPAQVGTTCCLELSSAAETVAFAGLCSSLPVDYLVKVSGKADIWDELISRFPYPRLSLPERALALRILRLNCLTADYAALWEELYDPAWQEDGWTDQALARSSLGAVGPEWSMETPLRRDQDRWQALVELDALAALMLGLTAEQLCAMYRTQFAVLRKYEYKMVFDAEGRKICGHHQSAGYRQAQLQDQAKAGDLPKDWKNLWNLYEQYEADPTSVDWAGHYTEPFTRVDREAAMTRAHETFAARHQDHR